MSESSSKSFLSIKSFRKNVSDLKIKLNNSKLNNSKLNNKDVTELSLNKSSSQIKDSNIDRAISEDEEIEED